MKWSRYNLLFRSKKFGLMLYNGLTNSLMEVKPGFETELERIRQDPDGYDFSKCFGVFTEMLKNRVLVNEDDERDLVDAMKMRKLAARFDSSTLALTLMVTEDCNFGCPYCYEKHKRAQDMTPETQDRLIEFIKGFLPLRQLAITWFGGEPLMRFDIMASLNERIRALDIPYGSMIVTNGWLLTEEVTAKLRDLRAGEIQVTIEGPPEIHNRKRFHLEHGDSFHVIQANLDRLMLDEQWPGQLRIHYNIDETNADAFAATYDYWMGRYKDGNVHVGRSFVDRNERGARDMGCCFDKEQETQFYINQYRQHGGKGLRYYPRRHQVGCIATKKNGFVVGAEGQLYKCWDEVGRKDREIGSIHTDPKTWNQALIARYLVGVEPFDDPTCQQCFCLPICEECPNIWYRRKYEGQEIDTCANYRDRLPEFLEIHYALSKRRQQAGLGP